MGLFLFLFGVADDLLDTPVDNIFSVTVQNGNWVALLNVCQSLVPSRLILLIQQEPLPFELEEERAAYFICLAQLRNFVGLENVLFACLYALLEELLQLDSLSLLLV